jgi:membrane protease subunit (stomatin/prohibitin family)
MNSVRNIVIIETKYLLRYKEFLYNYKQNNQNKQNNHNKQNNQNKLPKTNKICFCTICGDDCICTNNHYNFQKNVIKN